MPCYVIDNNDEHRYLTPLLRHNSSYQVVSADQEMYINVCTEANICPNNGSACIRGPDGHLITVGLWQRNQIDFHPSTLASKHEYIELVYKSTLRDCPNKLAVTKIRFLCPGSFGILDSSRRVPTLVSNLDCHYEIEWITDYACPMKQITTGVDQQCRFENLNLAHFRQANYHQVDNITIRGESNWSLIFNVCGNVNQHPLCKNSAACLVHPNQTLSIGLLKEAKFIKADNHLNLVFIAPNPTCRSGETNKKKYNTIVEFECDESVDFGSPKLIYFEDCTLLVRWKTRSVCPLFEPQLPCAYFPTGNRKDPFIDLSSLTKHNGQYVAQTSLHLPKAFYQFPKAAGVKILFNVCDRIPVTPQTLACNHSAACLIDEKNNVSISLGYYTTPLRYRQELTASELIYTGGYDPRTKKNVTTKITFHCDTWNNAFNANEPYLIDYDGERGQYNIEFNTLAACPRTEITGVECKLFDTHLNKEYNFNPLRSVQYYTVKTNDPRYEFEVNVCGPIVNGSCPAGTAICQKELTGAKRNFSLGKFSNSIRYMAGNFNMTFIDGSPYNDQSRTPRKSHISFICDAKAGNGYPEFDGENDQAYFFRWYSALACPGETPKVTHCVFENETHFFDLSPLSLKRGNHFVVGEEENTIAYINFCRPLNENRDMLLKQCKRTSAICLIRPKSWGSLERTQLNLGEPVGYPFMGFDGKIYLLYNNGDECPQNRSRRITSRVRIECSENGHEELALTMVDPQRYHIKDGDQCTYEFIAESPLACPKKISDYKLEKCIFVDPRTNQSADLNELTDKTSDYVVKTATGQQSAFFLNMCKPVTSLDVDCKDSAVCFRGADKRVVSYGKTADPKVYVEGLNLHIRFTGGTPGEDKLENRERVADIELICDQTARLSSPTLYFFNDYMVKFQWRTASVCNLAIPTCSLFDAATNSMYSLRQLASRSHVWNVTTNGGDSYYLINVCRSLPLEHTCGSSSAVCHCKLVNGQPECTNEGKASDHELSLLENQDLLLTYDEGDETCPDGNQMKTQINFKCSHELGFDGPKFLTTNHCTHHFVWSTIFACSHHYKSNKTVNLLLDFNSQVRDDALDIHYNFAPLFESTFNVTENPRGEDEYHYLIDFSRKSLPEQCSDAAVCQVKTRGNFYRDIGSMGNFVFTEIGENLVLSIRSNSSKCGRNANKQATTKILFTCSPSSGVGQPNFAFESEDCEYFFYWDTIMACIDVGALSPIHERSSGQSSSLSPLWITFLMLLVMVVGFALWLTFASSPKRFEPTTTFDPLTFNLLPFLQRHCRVSHSEIVSPSSNTSYAFPLPAGNLRSVNHTAS